MAYIKHDKQLWDTEADFIIKEFAKDRNNRMSLFESYCNMQLHHCHSDGTSPEALKRIREVCEGLRSERS